MVLAKARLGVGVRDIAEIEADELWTYVEKKKGKGNIGCWVIGNKEFVE